MTPSHHIPEEWLVGYANGTLEETAAVLVATHLTYCPFCRGQLEVAETAAADALTNAPEEVLDPGGLDALLARLDEPEPEPVAMPTDPVLPWPVLQYCGPMDALVWSWLAPGIKGVDLLPRSNALPLRLVRMKAGSKMFHGHEGDEAAVILAGGWDDQFGTFRQGDVPIVSADVELHEQVIHDDEDCIAIVLNDARGVVPGWIAGPVSRLLFKI